MILSAICLVFQQLVTAEAYTQTLIFEKDGDKYMCNLKITPSIYITDCYIYRYTDQGANKAKPVDRMKPKPIKDAALNSSYTLEINTKKGKVKKDGTIYSFQLHFADKDKEPIFSEPWGYNTEDDNFDYASELPTPIYKTVTFWICVIGIIVIIVGIASYFGYKKMKKQTPEEEL
ncbi:hypothetical protein NUSPORA_00874 [Nucleospora cyclopteri]